MVSQLRDEIELLKEKVVTLSKAEAKAEMYKKRLENVGEVKDQLRLANLEKQELEGRIEELEGERMSTGNFKEFYEVEKENVKKLKARNSELESDLIVAQNNVKRLESEVHKMAKKIENLEAQKVQLAADVEKARMRKESDSEDLLSTSRVQELEHEVKTLQREKERLLMRGDTVLNNTIIKLESQLEDKTIEADRLQQSLDLSNTRCSELEKENDALQGEIDKLNHEEYKHEDLENEFRMLKNEKNAALDKLSQAQKRIKTLEEREKELERVLKDKAQLSKELQKLFAEKAEIHEQLMSSKEENLKALS